MNKEKLKETAIALVKEHAAHQLHLGFRPAGLHPYYDENGELIYFKIRLKHPDGQKWIRPFHFNPIENKYVMLEPKLSHKKPLYNLLELKNRPNEPVLILEGEVCCEKALKLGLLAVTSGSATSAKQTNWLPLANRKIYIWPDNNQEGFKYAEEVKQILATIKCEIHVIDVKKLEIPEKGDIIDWIKENPTASKTDIISLPMIEDNSLKQKNIMRKTNTNEMFPDIEPWHEHVDGNNLLDELEELIHRLITFPSEHEAKATALYIVHTHCFEAANCSPILNISSPEKRCGKSTLLSVLQQLVSRPLIASSISSAAIFRSIEKWKPTLILDEADTFIPKNEEIRGVINSGHTKELAYVIRCMGTQFEPTRFSTWCPKIIAGIGHLPGTIEDRSIIIKLHRKLNNERKDKLRDIPKLIIEELSRKCARFAIDNIDNLKRSKPYLHTSLNDRAADNWSSLTAIAELAGEDWIKATARAAIYMCGTKEEPISIGVELLQDIKNIFDSKDVNRLSTNELLNALCAEEEAPWATYNGKEKLSARQLASKLKGFKIRSKDMRIPPSNRNLKGYALDDFSEAFSRYIPSSPPEQEDSTATPRQPCNTVHLKDFNNRDTNNLSREENPCPLPSDADCSVVADKISTLDENNKTKGNHG